MSHRAKRRRKTTFSTEEQVCGEDMGADTTNSDDGWKSILQQINTQLADIKLSCTKLDGLDKRVSTCERQTTAVVTHIDSLQNQVDKLGEKCLRMECEMYRNDLILINIPENGRENVYNVVCDFFQRGLRIDHPDRIPINYVRRLGLGPSNSRARPILVQFGHLHDKLHILGNRRFLRGTNFYLREHYPEEIEERRKPLYAVAKQARVSGKKTNLVRDKLYINGEEYKPNFRQENVQKADWHSTPMDISARQDFVRSAPPPTTNPAFSFGSKIPTPNSENATVGARLAPFVFKARRPVDRVKKTGAHVSSDPNSSIQNLLQKTREAVEEKNSQRNRAIFNFKVPNDARTENKKPTGAVAAPVDKGMPRPATDKRLAAPTIPTIVIDSDDTTAPQSKD